MPIEAYNISWEIICLLYNFLCLYRSYGSCIIYTAKVKSTKSRCSVIELHKLINRWSEAKQQIQQQEVDYVMHDTLRDRHILDKNRYALSE